MRSRAPCPGGNVQKSKAKPQRLVQALPVYAEGAAKGTNPWRGLCLGQCLLARTLAVDPYPPPQAPEQPDPWGRQGVSWGAPEMLGAPTRRIYGHGFPS